MKKVLFIMAAALMTMMQCKKQETMPVTPVPDTVKMTITAGSGSKTDITTAGAITWSSGDKLYVGYNGKYVGCLTLQGAGGSATGTFNGNVTLPDGTTGEKEFGFFYLGSGNGVTPAVGATSVDVPFATQEIYENSNHKLENVGKYYIGYGSAKGTVSSDAVTGINVTLVSKVALARFSFKKGDAAYDGALTLSGDNIYNDMTVGFNGSFNHGATPGTISLTGSHNERYVMLVPTGDAEEQTLTFAGSSESGTGAVPGLQSNKFYGKESAIEVTLAAPTPTHEYVDLGLPSGLLWATCNLGASSPEEYGDYYAWGEILPYYADGHSQDSPCSTWRNMTTGAGNTDISNGYAWTTYSQGGSGSFVEWTAKPYGSDNILTSAHDAATVAWGSAWRMPTEAEFTELINNTNRSWTTENGVSGWKCVSTKTGYTDKYIFLPAAGYRFGTSLSDAGSYGYYWSSSLSTSHLDYGRTLDFYSGYFYVNYSPRVGGITVRPVCPPQN